jgi:hypothetical protein
MPLLPAVPLLFWAAADPTAVLTGARRKVLDNIRRIPNYTCVETVERSYFEPDGGRPPRACADLAQWKADGHPLKLAISDRLRLEVAVAPDREMYSWVGERNFAAGEIDEIVRFGPIGTGSFTSFLGNIFGGKVTTMTYLGETEAEGRLVARFRYAVPKEQSRYRVRTRDAWVITAFDGEALIDPASFELVRLGIRTSELPRETGSCQSSSTLEYATMKIGGSAFLLPKVSRQRFIARSGMETENVTTFSACREYKGESVIRFDLDPETAAKAKDKEAEGLSLSSGLAVTVEWTSAIDTARAAAGDAVPGKLARVVRDRRTKVLLPAGARVEGRLMRVQVNHAQPPVTTIVRRVETVEVNGARMPLQVRASRIPDRMTRGRPAAAPTPFPHEAAWEILRLPGARPVIKAGARSDWVTGK